VAVNRLKSIPKYKRTVERSKKFMVILSPPLLIICRHMKSLLTIPVLYISSNQEAFRLNIVPWQGVRMGPYYAAMGICRAQVRRGCPLDPDKQILKCPWCRLLQAHDEDNSCNIGDVVRIHMSRSFNPLNASHLNREPHKLETPVLPKMMRSLRSPRFAPADRTYTQNSGCAWFPLALGLSTTIEFKLLQAHQQEEGMEGDRDNSEVQGVQPGRGSGQGKAGDSRDGA